jgi:hypothetical protein
MKTVVTILVAAALSLAAIATSTPAMAEKKSANKVTATKGTGNERPARCSNLGRRSSALSFSAGCI